MHGQMDSALKALNCQSAHTNEQRRNVLAAPHILANIWCCLCILDFSYSNRLVMVSHWGFNSKFLNDMMLSIISNRKMGWHCGAASWADTCKPSILYHSTQLPIQVQVPAAQLLMQLQDTALVGSTGLLKYLCPLGNKAHTWDTWMDLWISGFNLDQCL